MQNLTKHITKFDQTIQKNLTKLIEVPTYLTNLNFLKILQMFKNFSSWNENG